MTVRRIVLTGLTTMGVVALLSAIWPDVAAVVAAVFATVLTLAVLTPTVLGVRWLRAELAERRELLGPAPVGIAMYGAAASAPTFAELRESA